MKAALLTQIAKLQIILNDLLAQQPLYQAALRHLGIDASPRDAAPDELGCAETVSTFISTVVPGFPIVTGTYTLWKVLEGHPRFVRIAGPIPGAVMISPTGTQHRLSPIRNGHVAICGMGGVVMSNSSASGRFEENFTQRSWQEYYGRAGFPTYYYKLK